MFSVNLHRWPFRPIKRNAIINCLPSLPFLPFDVSYFYSKARFINDVTRSLTISKLTSLEPYKFRTAHHDNLTKLLQRAFASQHCGIFSSAQKRKVSLGIFLSFFYRPFFFCLLFEQMISSLFSTLRRQDREFYFECFIRAFAPPPLFVSFFIQAHKHKKNHRIARDKRQIRYKLYSGKFFLLAFFRVLSLQPHKYQIYGTLARFISVLFQTKCSMTQFSAFVYIGPRAKSAFDDDCLQLHQIHSLFRTSHSSRIYVRVRV